MTLDRTDLLPNVWGAQQLFAFSGFDGPTSAARGFPAATLGKPAGIYFGTPGLPRLWVGVETASGVVDGAEGRPFARIEPKVVASDVIDMDCHLGDSSLRLQLVWLDSNRLAGRISLRGASRAALRPFVATDLPAVGEAEAGPCITCRGADTPAPFPGDAEGARQWLLPAEGGRFAVVSQAATNTPLKDLAASAMAADLDVIEEKRLQFFERVPEIQAGEPVQRALAKAWSVMKVNAMSPEGALRYRWATPDRMPHRWMWLWDTCFMSFGYGHLHPPLVKELLLTMLEKRQPDGFLPHMLTTNDGDSDITQPPLVAWAAWQHFTRTGDMDLLRRAHRGLSDYLRWDMENLGRADGGLLQWQHGHASGMDNSPRFDAGSDVDAVDLNSFVASELEHMALIAEALGERRKARGWRRLREDWARRVQEALWCEEDGIYYDRMPSGDFARIKTCASFAPLFAGIPTRDQAARLVARLSDPGEFWTPVPIPSVARGEPTFGDDMWRGPMWPPYDFLIICGLRRYGFDRLAGEIAGRFTDEVVRQYQQTGAIWEFYDCLGERPPPLLHRKGRVVPVRGEGIPVVGDLCWSACLFAHLAIERYGSNAQQG